MPVISPVLRKFASVCLVLLLTVLVFWPALSGGFLFDDYPIFVENPVVHIASWNWQPWYALWVWSHANIQRPMAMLTYALNFAMGSGTWGFKATNLFIHALNVVLAVWLAQRILAVAWHRERSEHANAVDYWAMGIAAAWALHPLQVSAVMYVVQRMELRLRSYPRISLLQAR